MIVSLVAAISVDGRIAQKEGQTSTDWTSQEDKKFFVEKTKEAGVLVMGRKTYETIGRPLPNRLNVIMTRDVGQFESIEGTLEFTKATPAGILTDLEIRGFKEVIIAGGAGVYSLFLKEGLVTDLYLTVEPIIFGAGIPLIDGIDSKRLELVESKKLGEQSVLLHYRIL